MQLMEHLVGLSIDEVKSIFLKDGITNYEIVYYTDRKQKSYDTDIVVRVILQDGKYVVLVCPMKMNVSEGD